MNEKSPRPYGPNSAKVFRCVSQMNLAWPLQHWERWERQFSWRPQRHRFGLLINLKRPGLKLSQRDDPCVLPKACKNTVELQGVRNAHIRDGAALCHFLAWLSDAGPAGGVDELSAVDKLYGFRAGGDNFKGLSFDTISGAGANGAVVHYRVTRETNRKLESGVAILGRFWCAVSRWYD